MRSLGHHRWLYNITFPPSPVFSCPSCVSKTKSIPVHSLILSSHLFLFFFALCLAEPSLLSQKTLRCGQTTLISVSWPRSGLRYVFQWLPGSFFELPHWWHGPCMRCSVTFRSISSRRCVLFSGSAVKVSDSQAYRNVDLTKKRISFTFGPRDMLFFLRIGFSFVRAAVACEIN